MRNPGPTGTDRFFIKKIFFIGTGFSGKIGFPVQTASFFCWRAGKATVFNRDLWLKFIFLFLIFKQIPYFCTIIR